MPLDLSALQAPHILQDLVATSALGVVVADLQGIITGWSRGAERIYGWSEAEVLGRFMPMIPEEKRDEYFKLRDTMLSGRGLNGVAIRRRRKDGSSLALTMTVLPLRDADGAVTGTFAIVSDVTEADAAEAELRQSQKIFQTILAHTSDIISILDRDGLIRYVSPSVERILGYQQDEFAGRRASEFVHPDDQGQLAEANAERFAGASTTVELRVRHKDGTWRTFESVGRSVDDGTGRIIAITTSRDLTERRKRETARSGEHDRLRRRLNSLLTAIIGYADLLAEEAQTSDSRRAYAVALVDNGREAAGIARRLLDPNAPAAPRVLVADDEAPVRALVSSILTREGCTVQEAPDAEAALSLLGTTAFDLLITDVRMPGMNGVDLARRVAEIHPATRILFMSGGVGDVVLPPGAPLLSKPFSREDLLRFVRTALPAR